MYATGLIVHTRGLPRGIDSGGFLTAGEVEIGGVLFWLFQHSEASEQGQGLREELEKAMAHGTAGVAERGRSCRPFVN